MGDYQCPAGAATQWEVGYGYGDNISAPRDPAAAAVGSGLLKVSIRLRDYLQNIQTQ